MEFCDKFDEADSPEQPNPHFCEACLRENGEQESRPVISQVMGIRDSFLWRQTENPVHPLILKILIQTINESPGWPAEDRLESSRLSLYSV